MNLFLTPSTLLTEEFPAVLLGSFPADVCPDITGQVGCGPTAKLTPAARGWGCGRKVGVA